MITVGTDPEFFVTYEGSVVPAYDVFKKAGIQNRHGVMCGSLYVDGAAVELQPWFGYDVNELVENFKVLLNTAVELLGPIHAYPEYPIDLNICKVRPEVAIFGCDPDKSIWGDTFSPGKINASKHPWRYGGCHMHFGNLPTDNFELILKTLDRVVGMAHLAYSGDEGIQRLKIYGRPGIYRIQPHGIEYRTPSNTITRTEESFRYFFELGVMTIEHVTEISSDLKSVIPDDLLLEVLGSGHHTIATEVWNMVQKFMGIPEMPEKAGDLQWTL